MSGEAIEIVRGKATPISFDALTRPHAAEGARQRCRHSGRKPYSDGSHAKVGLLAP
jgi:CDGSH-type Zn-finger protein